MKSRDRFLTASRAFTLASAGASHARTAADALERIAADALALYHDARQQVQEDQMEQQIEKISEHLDALKAAVSAGDLAKCERHCAEITAADPGAPEGRRIPVANVPQVMQLRCYGARAAWYEQRRLPQLEAAA